VTDECRATTAHHRSRHRVPPADVDDAICDMELILRLALEATREAF
jgi:hypothetical protein